MKKIVITADSMLKINPEARKRLEEAEFLIEEYPDAIKYSEKELISILKDAEAVIAGLEKYPRTLLEKLPSLKLLARRGVGVDNIDLESAKTLGITVTRTEGLVGVAVSELIMAYLLDHARLLSSHSSDMKHGIWSRKLAVGLKGKTLGLVGFGSIAKETAIRANSFGMKILCYYRHRNQVEEETYSVQFADFDSLISTSDYISINVPLTEDTRNMFYKEVFHQMKPTSVLINTARSAIINTSDLIEALNSSQIGGAYLDVYDTEPCHDMALLSCNNANFTPHIGTFTRETFEAMNNRCVEQVIEYFQL